MQTAVQQGREGAPCSSCCSSFAADALALPPDMRGLAKLTSLHLPGIEKIGSGHYPLPRQLQFLDAQHATASGHIYSFTACCNHMAGNLAVRTRLNGAAPDTKRLAVQLRPGHRPGLKGAYKAVNLRCRPRPVD